MNVRRCFLTLAICFGALLLMQPLARADVSITLTGGYGGSGGGYLLSPYQLTVAGVPNWALSCDDFSTDIPVPYTWDANVYTLQGLINDGSLTTNAGSPQQLQKFDQKGAATVTEPWGTTYTVEAQYFAAAILATDILAHYSGWGPSSQALEDNSFALWGIFTQGAFNSDTTTTVSCGGLTNAECIAKGELDHVTTEIAHNQVTDVPDVTIYTPSSGYTSQEFILGLGDPITVTTRVPEGSSLIFLAFDLLVLFAGAFLVRKYAHLN